MIDDTSFLAGAFAGSVGMASVFLFFWYQSPLRGWVTLTYNSRKDDEEVE